MPAPLITLARREEITEMYRRKVWVEKSVEDCLRDTGKLPIPVRWVVTNKGDRLHLSVRCRLVAMHLAAKYGGKDMEDLFAAMPGDGIGIRQSARLCLWMCPKHISMPRWGQTIRRMSRCL